MEIHGGFAYTGRAGQRIGRQDPDVAVRSNLSSEQGQGWSFWKRHSELVALFATNQTSAFVASHGIDWDPFRSPFRDDARPCTRFDSAQFVSLSACRDHGAHSGEGRSYLRLSAKSEYGNPPQKEPGKLVVVNHQKRKFCYKFGSCGKEGILCPFYA
jgi:hypothetical protein